MQRAPSKKGSILDPTTLEVLKNFDVLPDAANVRQAVVEALFSCSSATLWRRVGDGGIPKPRKMSKRISAWNVGEIRLALLGEQRPA